MKLFEAVTHLLQEHPIFSGLEGEALQLIAGCASLTAFREGDYLYREAQAVDHFFIIHHGQVAVQVHIPGRDDIVVDMLKEGDVLGWAWLIPPYRHAFDARAVLVSRVVAFDAVCLRGKMERLPALGYELYKRMTPLVAARLAATRRRLLDLYGNPAERGATGWH